MVSIRMWRAIGIAGAGFAGAMLLGITKVINILPDTNLFNTGITPGLVFGIWLIVIAIAIQKNRI
ncbi:hypothetical protein LCGC14_1055550 [marine sediment metagenome]|uniref:Uncharacterized protein n=1 Tax=marine sediment metagenome TaxID=412755 RepID=A0A0F9MMN1_9ZZZZ